MDRRTTKSKILEVYLANESALHAFISRFVYRRHDIDDISQEAFLRAYKAERKTKIQNPKAFLYKVARNVALDELKKKSNLLTEYIEDIAGFDVLQTEKSFEERFDDKETFKVFCEAVSMLAPKCQKVFIMRRVYGFTQKEIARELGISVSTVEKHIATGLRRCRAALLQHAQNGADRHQHASSFKVLDISK